MLNLKHPIFNQPLISNDLPNVNVVDVNYIVGNQDGYKFQQKSVLKHWVNHWSYVVTKPFWSSLPHSLSVHVHLKGLLPLFEDWTIIWEPHKLRNGLVYKHYTWSHAMNLIGPKVWVTWPRTYTHTFHSACVVYYKSVTPWKRVVYASW